MLAARRARQWSPLSVLLVLSVLGCDRAEPLAPDAPLFASGGGTVAAPSNVVATAVAANQIDVAWQDNSDNESGFEIHRAVTGQSAFDLWTTTGPDVTSQRFIGVAAEREYCVKARAFTARGKSRTYSEFSDSSCASTALPPVAPPQTVVTPLHSSAVSIWWQDNSTNEDGFRVERSLDEEASWTVVATTGPSPFGGLTQGALKSEQPVCYRVIAFNEHGESAPAADCTTPPAGPTGLVASGSAAGGIALTWADNSAVEDGYDVLRSPVEYDYYAYLVIAALPPNSTGYRDGAVSGNARYWYAVRARKDNGYSSRSNTANAVAATTPPNAPSGTDAVPTGSGSISVTWLDNSSNEDGFRVERSLDGGASWGAAGTTGGSNYPQGWFRDLDRPSDQPVCYRILAFNSLGDSPPSNSDCTAPPAAPTGLVATTVEGLAIDLTWTDNSGVEDGYEVQLYYCDYRYQEPYCDYFTVAALGPNAASDRYTGLTPSLSYTYRVFALKDGSRSDPSNDASAWSDFAPAAPSNLTATAASPGQIDLRWTDNSGSASSFAIERCEGDDIACDDAAFLEIGWADGQTTTFSDTGVVAGTTYTYRVRAYDGRYSNPSNEAAATTPQ